jgi:hypothetical protein
MLNISPSRDRLLQRLPWSAKEADGVIVLGQTCPRARLDLRVLYQNRLEEADCYVQQIGSTKHMIVCTNPTRKGENMLCNYQINLTCDDKAFTA